MKNLIIIAVLVNVFFCYSQDNENKREGAWIINNDIGFSNIEAKNLFKLNANIVQGFIGRDISLNKNVSIISGLEVLRLSADYSSSSNEQLFLKNTYINLPLSLRYSTLVDVNKLGVFIDFGIYGSYLMKSKIENMETNSSHSNKSLGFNFGIQTVFGFVYKFTKNAGLQLGIKSKSDLFESYKKGNTEFKLKDFYAFQLGLKFQL